MSEFKDKIKELIEDSGTMGNKELKLKEPEEVSDHVRLYTSIRIPDDTKEEDFKNFDLIMEEIDSSMRKILKQETEEEREDLNDERYEIFLYEDGSDVILAPIIHLPNQKE